MIRPSDKPATFLQQLPKGMQVRTSDPALRVPGVAPGFGHFPLAHIDTFAGRYASAARTYLEADEALRDSIENARVMRNDCGVMECLEARQRAVALLDWHLEPEDERDAKQVKLCEDLTRIIQRIGRFQELRRNLMEAIWYGRYAIQCRYKWETIAGRRCVVPARVRDNPGWRPIHGDKLVWRAEYYGGDPRADQLGIRVSSGQFSDGGIIDVLGRRAKIEATNRGMAYFLDPAERDRVTIHKHMIEDGEFEDVRSGGRIHGVGIRSRIYWEWVQKQELMALLMLYVERAGGGVLIWTYPEGNEEALYAAQNAAQQMGGGGRTDIFFPKPIGDDANAYGIEVIEPGMGGVDQLQNLLAEYFGHRIKRYILGQTLTSEAEGTGLGSGVADAHIDTFMQIVEYDSNNLDETLTHELVTQLKNWNFPEFRSVHVRFVSELTTDDVQEKLAAMQTAWQMNARITEREVLTTLGIDQPGPDDRVLDGPGAGGGGLGGLLGGMGGGPKPGGGPEPPGGDGGGDPPPEPEGGGGEGVRDGESSRYSTGQRKIDWNEEEHPRDEDGKFALVGGTAKREKPAPPKPSLLEQIEDDIKKSRHESLPGQLDLFGEGGREAFVAALNDGFRQRKAQKTLFSRIGFRLRYAKKGDQKSFGWRNQDGQKEFQWITLNGGSGDDGDGGTRVMIDKKGNIKAGPDALEGKNLDNLGDDGGEKEAPKPTAAELAKESHENNENISTTMRRHGLDPVRERELRAGVAEEREKILEKEAKKKAEENKPSPARQKAMEAQKKRQEAEEASTAEPGKTVEEQWDGLPDEVKEHVKRHVERFQGELDRLEQGKRTDRMVGGEGRYEAEQYPGVAKRFREIDEDLNRFRELAKENGVDGDALISHAGKPDLPEPSDNAREWLEDTGEPVVKDSLTTEDDPEPARMEVNGRHWSQGNLRYTDYEPVLVDISKLDAAWKKDEQDYVTKGGEQKEGARAQFEGFLETAGSEDNPIEMPAIANIRRDGSVKFADGRHRFAVLRDQGETQIPVLVHPEDREAFDAMMNKEPELNASDAPKSFQGPYTLESFYDMRKRVKSGDISAEELKAQYRYLRENESETIAGLSKAFDAKKLRNIAGNLGDWRASRNTKAANAKSVYRSLLGQYNLASDSVTWSMGGSSYEEELDKLVDSVTDEHIQGIAQEWRDAQPEIEAARAAKAKALENPETLEEFTRFHQEKGIDQLTDEQLARYDDLRAAARREKDSAGKSTTVESFSGGEEATGGIGIVEGHHKKRDKPTYTVTIENHLGDDKFKEALSRAKQLGGSYVNARIAKAYGATPGFQFFDEKTAEAFADVLRGNDADRSEMLAEREAERAERSADRLAERAEALADRGEEALGRDRKTNTHKRAREAASAEAEARKTVARAKTLGNIADAIRSGEAKHLAGVRQNTDLDTLDSVLSSVRTERYLKESRENGGGVNYEKSIQQPVTETDIRGANYPYPQIWPDHLQLYGHKLAEVPGLKRVAAGLLKAAKKVKDPNTPLYVTDPRMIDDLKKAASRLRNHSDWQLRSIGTRFTENLTNYNRLQRMDIRDRAELRAVLREYLPHKATADRADPVKAAERKLIGQKIPGFFPTPRRLIDTMLDRADIQEGHSVLEPSAGKGDILDAIKERHPNANARGIEQYGPLHELVQLKGHQVDRGDFLENQESYDRIVMNPPFEKGQDIDHVRHAYDRLKPGGKVVAIMSESPFSNQNKKADEFRSWLESVGGESEKLPEGAFAGTDAFRQTGVNTRLVVLSKPGAQKYSRPSQPNRYSRLTQQLNSAFAARMTTR